MKPALRICALLLLLAPIHAFGDEGTPPSETGAATEGKSSDAPANSEKPPKKAKLPTKEEHAACAALEAFVRVELAEYGKGQYEYIVDGHEKVASLPVQGFSANCLKGAEQRKTYTSPKDLPEYCTFNVPYNGLECKCGLEDSKLLCAINVSKKSKKSEAGKTTATRTQTNTGGKNESGPPPGGGTAKTLDSPETK